MADKTLWDNADFDEWSWHDCQIRSIGFEHDWENYRNDLVLEVDFILTWIRNENNSSFNFQVAPAKLIFHGVNNLKINIAMVFLEALIINQIIRKPLDTPQGGYQWVIEWHTVNEWDIKRIEFQAISGEQSLLGKPIHTEQQRLTTEQRLESLRG